jgi:tetratricopeptide (TPR) repeat protein
VAPAAEEDRYTSAWIGLNKLLRQGFSWSGRERHCAFLNVGDGAFADVAAVIGFDSSDDGRAAALCDWDQDGDTDLFLTNRTGPRVRFFRNDQEAGNRSVAFSLRQPTENRDAIGARVELELEDGRRAIATVRAGEGYLAQSSTRVGFGLGQGSVASVAVRWPDGERERFEAAGAEGLWILERGSGVARAFEPPGEPSVLRPSPVVPPRSSERARVVLAAPLPMPRLAILSDDGQDATLFGIEAGGRPVGTGRPVLVAPWASWCAPCVGELSSLAEHLPELQRRGLAVLALGAEAERGTAAARELLERARWPLPAAYAPEATLEILDALQGVLLDRETRLPLPSSFLVDARGNLVAFYAGAVEPETLLADLDLLALDPAARRDAAAAGTGRWLHAPAERDLALVRARFASRGLHDVAEEYARASVQVVHSSRAALLHEFGRRAGEQGRIEEAAEQFRRATEEDPSFAPAWVDLGVALHRLRHFARAVDAYRIALRLEPDAVTTRSNLILALLALGEREAAEAERDRLAPLDAAEAERMSELIRRLDER